MPKTMTSALTALKNELSQPGAWVWLMSFTLPNSGPTIRIATNTEDVTYDGNVYTAFNFAVDSFIFNAEAEFPEISLRFTNVGYLLQEYMRDYNGLAGSTVTFLFVNTDYLEEDYSEDLLSFTVNGCENRWPDVDLTLGVHPSLRRRVPEDRLNPHACRHRFGSARCEYTNSGNLVSVTLPSGTPVSVQMTGHPFVTADAVTLASITGLTPSLNDDWIVTKVDANNFTLDGTDGDDYSGSASGGTAEFTYCSRIPKDCVARDRFPGNYGGPLSLRREAVRYA